MNKIEIKAYAKINPAIDIIKKRTDGYHEVQMIMQSVELHDKVILNKTEREIIVKCDNPQVPEGEKNIAYRAAKIMFDKYNIQSGISIEIIKNIPISAGMAGGSSDAAAVIKGINQLFELKLHIDEQEKIALSIGADVPFCLMGGTVMAEGIGEKLTKISQLRPVDILIVKPKIDVSTKWVYENFKIENVQNRPNINEIINSIKEDNIEKFAKNMVNVLETVTAKKYPIIDYIKDIMMKNGAKGSIMSGSGSAVFGIFSDKENAKKAKKIIMQDEKIKNNCSCFITKTC